MRFAAINAAVVAALLSVAAGVNLFVADSVPFAVFALVLAVGAAAASIVCWRRADAGSDASG